MTWIVLLVLAAQTAYAAGAEPVYLGVLEGRTVRVAFQFQSGKWAPMPDGQEDLNPATMGARYPKRVSWTIAFDGKNLGTIESAQFKKYSNRTELGLQALTAESQARVQALGMKRRLVVVSRPNYQDPDRWKPFPAANDAAVGQARKAFHEEALKLEDKPCECPENLLRVCSKPYRSARGDVLVGLIPMDEKCDCYVFESWFLIRGGKAMDFRSVFGGGASLQLIDAGDYDGDGVSEVLFHEEGTGDARDALVLLLTRDASTVVFYLPGEYSF